MLCSKGGFGRRLLSSLRREKAKIDVVAAATTPSPPLTSSSADASETTSRRIPSPAYDGTTVQSLLQKLKRNAKLSNAKAYNPPANVEEIIEKVVRRSMPAGDDAWRSFSLSDSRLKYNILTELMAEFDCDVPNFLLSDIKNVQDIISHFKSPNMSAIATAAHMNPLEQLGAMQLRNELPPNIHVQVEYPGRVVKSSSGDTLESGEDDVRSKVYSGVDNIVTSVKYRRKYQGYTAKIKEPLV